MVYAITVMGKVKLLAPVAGEWAVPVMVCSIHNVCGAEVLEKSNVESVMVLEKENDTQTFLSGEYSDLYGVLLNQ